MKKRILLIICVLIVIVTVVGIVLLSIAQKEMDSSKTSLQTIQHEITELEKKYTENNRGVKSTVDEIEVINREIVEYGNLTNESQKHIRQLIVDYINTLYNYDGTIEKNRDKILNEIKKYADEDFVETQIRPSLYTGGNMTKKTKAHKKVNNFCTLEDTFYTSAEYDDGSDIHMVICALHYSDKTIYRELSLAEMEGGGVKIISDSLLSSTRIKLGSD